jgi:hypothetical protein
MTFSRPVYAKIWLHVQNLAAMIKRKLTILRPVAYDAYLRLLADSGKPAPGMFTFCTASCFPAAPGIGNSRRCAVATLLLPSDYTAIGGPRSRRVSCCLGLVGGLDGLIPEKGDYRVPPMSPHWANTAKKAARGASQLVRASPSENCCPFKLPLLLQHPRAVDTQDACMQVISPCNAWGEAW